MITKIGANKQLFTVWLDVYYLFVSHQVPNKRGRAAEKDVQLDWATSSEIPDKVI